MWLFLNLRQNSVKSVNKFLPSQFVAWSGTPRIQHYFQVWATGMFYLERFCIRESAIWTIVSLPCPSVSVYVDVYVFLCVPVSIQCLFVFLLMYVSVFASAAADMEFREKFCVFSCVCVCQGLLVPNILFQNQYLILLIN